MIVFKESHMTDGSIAVDVMLDDENIGVVYVGLSGWDRLRELAQRYGASFEVKNIIEAASPPPSEEGS